MKLAAVADIHARVDDEERVRALFADVGEEADALVLAGDLTEHGRAGEMEALVKGIREVGIPVVAVLGNHDHEDGHPVDAMRILAAAGVHVLDRKRPTAVIGDVGFAGVKGFGGGFAARIVRGFGEDSLKAFVAASIMEAEALRGGLRALDTPSKVALLHYSPIRATVEGEPPEIWAFLGSSRLEAAVDDAGADLVLHGHAHHGRPRGHTARGVPVLNVAMPVLHAAGEARPYALVEV